MNWNCKYILNILCEPILFSRKFIDLSSCGVFPINVFVKFKFEYSLLLLLLDYYYYFDQLHSLTTLQYWYNVQGWGVISTPLQKTLNTPEGISLFFGYLNKKI